MRPARPAKHPAIHLAKHQLAVALIFLFSVVIAVAPAYSAGGSSSPPATPSAPVLTPEEEAIELYNLGLKARDKAWKLEEELDAAPSEKLAGKMEKQFEKAAGKFESAVAKNPLFYQAHSSLGYALRRLGRFDESLAAYDKALELEPNYAEAIEYRAEAYLGLNRVDEAKAAYLELFRSDRERANELFDAMESWLEGRQADAAGLDSTAVEGFAAWLEERRKVAETTARLYQPASVDWSR